MYCKQNNMNKFYKNIELDYLIRIISVIVTLTKPETEHIPIFYSRFYMSVYV